MLKSIGLFGLLVAMVVGFNSTTGADAPETNEAAEACCCGESCECTSCDNCNCQSGDDCTCGDVCNCSGCGCQGGASEATCDKGCCDTDTEES